MTTNTSIAPPGWHPDPSNPGAALRWWDGRTWTTHTHQAAISTHYVAPSAYQAAASTPTVATTPAAAWPGGSPTLTSNHVSGSYGSGSYASANVSFAKRNSHSVTAIGVVALYVLLAVTTHFVLLGILPVLLSVRAIKAKETLAPAAVAAAVVAVAVAFAALQ